VHLLTREAFAGYLTRLAPKGVLSVHVSNRYMELAKVVAAVGATEGLVAYFKQDNTKNDDYRASAMVVALARDVADLGDLPSRPGWRKVEGGGVAPWTDDYSNVLGAIFRKKFGE
jgi:hypothetical protein